MKATGAIRAALLGASALSATAWSALALSRTHTNSPPADEELRAPSPQPWQVVPRVHAIVSAREAPDVLVETLSSLVAQSYDAFRVTLVAEAGDEDAVGAATGALRGTPHAPRFEVSWAETNGSVARKRGAFERGVASALSSGARPDFWLFVEAGVRCEAYLVSALVQAARRERLDAVSVSPRPQRASGEDEELAAALDFFAREAPPFGWCAGESNEEAQTGCVLARADAFEVASGGGLARCEAAQTIATIIAQCGGRTRRLTSARIASLRPAVRAIESIGMVAVATMWLVHDVPPLATALGLAMRDPWSAGFGAAAWLIMAGTFEPYVLARGRPRVDAFALPVAAARVGIVNLRRAFAGAAPERAGLATPSPQQRGDAAFDGAQGAKRSRAHPPSGMWTAQHRGGNGAAAEFAIRIDRG